MTAEIVVHCASGVPRLESSALLVGCGRVPLNAPIDIEVRGAVAHPLSGVDGDGRNVTLGIAPLPEGRASLDLAILVDRSGPMAEVATGGRGGASKHQTVIAGLGALASMKNLAHSASFDSDDKVDAGAEERPAGHRVTAR